MKHDTLMIRGLNVATHIGVYDGEKSFRQHLVLDMELVLPEGVVVKAANSDHVCDTLDYTALAAQVQCFAQTTSFQLVETFAERLADLLLKEFPLQKLTLYVQKPGALAQAVSVGIRVERSKLHCNG